MRTLLFAGTALAAALVSPVAISAQTAATSSTVVADGRAYVLTAEQKAVFDAWTQEQRAAYATWPYDSQVYYWTLSPEQGQAWWDLTDAQKATLLGWPEAERMAYYTWPAEARTWYWALPAERQTGYWSLTADQRGMIYKMTPDQQAAVWQSINAQANGQMPPTPAGQANPPGMGVPTTGVPNPQVAAQPVRPAMPADGTYQGGPYKGALTPPPADAMGKTYPVCTRTLQDSCRNRGGI